MIFFNWMGLQEEDFVGSAILRRKLAPVQTEEQLAQHYQNEQPTDGALKMSKEANENLRAGQKSFQNDWTQSCDCFGGAIESMRITPEDGHTGA